MQRVGERRRATGSDLEFVGNGAIPRRAAIVAVRSMSALPLNIGRSGPFGVPCGTHATGLPLAQLAQALGALAGGTRGDRRSRRAGPKPAQSNMMPPASEAVASAAGVLRCAESRMPCDVSESTDEQLLAESIEGDRAAFATIVERYRDELLHFLIRFLGSRSAAEDVFQDTFLQVHISARTFDQERRFKPWLFTIAANKARDHFRRNQRRAPLSLSNPLGDAAEGGTFVDLLQADLPSPDAPIADAERSRVVRTVIDALPVHHREILLLSYFQRMSYNQIADSLEIPLGTVKSRLHAAVANFAAAWKTARAALDGPT